MRVTLIKVKVIYVLPSQHTWNVLKIVPKSEHSRDVPKKSLGMFLKMRVSIPEIVLRSRES